jgi:uncharacterized protein YraI
MLPVRLISTLAATLGLAAGATLVHANAAAAAEDSCTYRISSPQGLNVRSGPGLSYGVWATLQYGQIVSAHGFSAVGQDGYDWTSLYSPDAGGYVALEFMTKLSCH